MGGDDLASQHTQRLIRQYVESRGAEVSIVENGALAVTAAIEESEAGHPYDVILMDMQMPEMDGYEATAALRSLGYTGPIIAVTAHVLAAERERCFSAGCDHFIPKPIEPEFLVDAIFDSCMSSE